MLALTLTLLMLPAQSGKDMEAAWPSCPTVQGRPTYSVLVFGVNAEGQVTSTSALAGDPAFLEEASADAKTRSFPLALPNSYYGLFCTTDASARLGYIFDQSVFRGPRPPARIAPAVAQENLTQKVDPRYPAVAKAKFIQGLVKLDIAINADGAVASAVPLSGHPELYHSAVEAVRQWKYKPFTVSGKPVAVETTVTIPFAVNR